jgi:hypothetical protein
MADAKFFDDFWKIKGYLGANPDGIAIEGSFTKRYENKG